MAFGITWVTIPSIVKIAKLKNLCANKNNRTLHTNATPTLGGIAVFAALIISSVVFSGPYFTIEMKYIITGLIIIFFLGIKDDILVIAPLKKLAGQIIAVGLIAIFANIRISSLFGFFHIQQLPYIVSILLTLFVFIVIINGYNLIDGIDGLASGIAILTSSVFGIWFWLTGDIASTILSFSFAGTLAAFFYFNVFSKQYKIFLGDTGSMVIGFVMGIIVCRFLHDDLLAQGALKIVSAPAVACGILVVPLFDSLRVFIIRIVQGKSPFKADRQHIHHNLLQLGYTHLQATLILIGVNFFFIVLSFVLRDIGIIWLMTVIVGLASTMTYFLVNTVKERKEKAFELSRSFFMSSEILEEMNNVIALEENQNEKVEEEKYAEIVNATVN